MIEGCKFRFIGDISASTAQGYLADQKRNGMAQQTVNHYLRAIKQFSRWLVRDRRTGEDRLQHLSGGNVKAEGIRRERREFTDDEIGRILQATQAGPSRLGLSSEQRFMLYAAALGTGFRASELASLTTSAFDLDAEPSTVTLQAADEKRRRGAVQPSRPIWSLSSAPGWHVMRRESCSGPVAGPSRSELEGSSSETCRQPGKSG